MKAALREKRRRTDVAEHCFFAGFSRYESGAFSRAHKELAACERSLHATPFAAAALWYRALMFLLEDDHKEALPLLERLLKKHPRDRERDKHAYWLARAHESLGNEKARDRVLDNARLSPTSYYGLLAARRRGAQAPTGIALAPEAFAMTAKASKNRVRALLLESVGLEAAAHRVARQSKDRALSALVGDHHRAWRSGGRFIPRPSVKDGRVINAVGWRASYAMPHLEVATPIANKRGVPLDVVYAIMRTESGFMSDAVSLVGALGLMQLMPYTARGLADVLDQERPDPATLTTPEVNIPLGTSFLSISTKELGHPALAAAGYNGSPHNVARWLREFGDLEAELFVERVPFKETRNYIKRVSAVSAVYRALDGNALAIDLPAKFSKRPDKVTWFPRTYGE